MAYTSFDPGDGGRGGWQVKQSTGDPTTDELSRLQAGVATTFESAHSIPDFATQEQLLAMPRRLLHVPGPDGSAVYWHTIPAGSDSTGRPGNVFAHVVLDRGSGADGTPPVRPCDLWRSPDWATPYGADAVRRSELAQQVRPGPGPIGRAQVVAFLCDPVLRRSGTLSLVLDAVLAALQGGPVVVIGVDNPDWGAIWISAVSHLMSSGGARGLGFSTLERATVPTGVHLIAVDRGDLENLGGRPDLVLVDTHQQADLGFLGGDPHRTSLGVAVAVTEWSVLAEALLDDDPAEVARALDAVDAVAHDVDQPGLDPRWPLAMLAASGHPALASCLTEAADVIERFTPEELEVRAPEAFLVAAAFIRTQLAADPHGLWQQLPPEPTAGTTVFARLVLHAYLMAALADRTWSSQPGGPKLPPWFDRLYRGPDAEIAAQAKRQLDEQYGRSLAGASVSAAPEDPFHLAAWALGLVAVAGRIGLLRPGTHALDLDRVSALLESTVVPMMVDSPTGSTRILVLLKQLADPEALAEIRQLAVNAQGWRNGVPGQRVSPEMLAFLFPRWQEFAPPKARELLKRPPGAQELVLQVVDGRLLAAPEVRGSWLLAAWAYRTTAKLAVPPQYGSLLLDHVDRDPRSVLGDLVDIASWFGPIIDLNLTKLILLRLPSDNLLEWFIQAVQQGRIYARVEGLGILPVLDLRRDAEKLPNVLSQKVSATLGGRSWSGVGASFDVTAVDRLVSHAAMFLPSGAVLDVTLAAQLAAAVIVLQWEQRPSTDSAHQLIPSLPSNRIDASTVQTLLQSVLVHDAVLEAALKYAFDLDFGGPGMGVIQDWVRALTPETEDTVMTGAIRAICQTKSRRAAFAELAAMAALQLEQSLAPEDQARVREFRSWAKEVAGGGPGRWKLGSR